MIAQFVPTCFASRHSRMLLNSRSRSLSPSFSSRRCSSFNCRNSSSSLWCHGYSTQTWKQNAELAITKLVRENPRVMIILGGGERRCSRREAQSTEIGVECIVTKRWGVIIVSYLKEGSRSGCFEMVFWVPEPFALTLKDAPEDKSLKAKPPILSSHSIYHVLSFRIPELKC